jgi:aspartate/tyrosine/aromatic aminotransferase
LVPYLASTTVHHSSPQASRQLEENPDIDHEYLPITGLPQFTKAAQGLIFGKQNKADEEGRVIRWVWASLSLSLISDLKRYSRADQ